MGTRRAEQQVVVEGAPSACFEALTDYEEIATWQSTVKSCEVLSHDPAGRGREVAWEIDAKVRSLSYTLEYSYDEPHRIACAFVEGDLKDLDAEYLFEEREDGTTLATFSLRVDPGTWVPGKVARILNDRVMRRSLEELKRRVEDGAGG
jgi:ribosome-associated toxin RatA of RatAB toxin-antitoxin module